MPQTRILLIRHGRSTFNDQGRHQGSSNESVLTAKGIRTAQLVGKYLQTTPIDVVYTSPLQRVQQTAHEILKTLPPENRPPVVNCHELKEISLSLWEGLTYQAAKQQFPAEYRCWKNQPHLFELPLPAPAAQTTRGEIATKPKTFFPVQDLYRHAKDFWQRLLSRHAGSTVLIVSHSGTNHALLSTALGALPCHHHSLQQSNCGLSELIFHHDVNHQGSTAPKVQLHQLNQTTMLGDSLPKIKAGKHGLRLLLMAAEGLTAEGCHRLAKRLESLPINFCLSASEAHRWLQLLTQPHPQTLELSTQSPSFSYNWQQHLQTSLRPQQTLTTGLAIVRAEQVQQLLSQLLGSQQPSTHIHLQPERFSVVHYPNGHRPVVQAINF